MSPDEVWAETKRRLAAAGAFDGIPVSDLPERTQQLMRLAAFGGYYVRCEEELRPPVRSRESA